MEPEKNEEAKNNIEEELQTCNSQKEEYLKNWQRERADFLNYKKEEAIRCSQMSDYSKISIFLDLINILDHFDLALKTLNDDLKAKPEIVGIINIKKQIESLLKTNGIEKIDCLNKIFNPEACEIIEEIEQDGTSQTVIEELQAGYIFKGKLIRPAKVKIIK
jgi:molecular chaperone GrpE